MERSYGKPVNRETLIEKSKKKLIYRFGSVRKPWWATPFALDRTCLIILMGDAVQQWTSTGDMMMMKILF